METLCCRSRNFAFSRICYSQPRVEHYKLHAHDSFELLFVIGGKGHYLVEGREYPLSADTVMIMRPGEVHCLLVDASVPYERVCINFREELIRDFDPEGLLLEPFFKRGLGERNRYELSCSEELLRLLPESGVGKRDGETALAAQLFLLRALFEISRRRDSGSAHDEPQPLEPVLRFINRNLFGELSLQDVAEHFYISPAQLNRRMKRLVGTTFWNYVLVKRLLASKSLLRQGIPAGEAARRCGFGEYSAYYRAYKKHFGASPRDEFAGARENAAMDEDETLEMPAFKEDGYEHRD